MRCFIRSEINDCQVFQEQCCGDLLVAADVDSWTVNEETRCIKDLAFSMVSYLYSSTIVLLRIVRHASDLICESTVESYKQF
jgi:hypothetical protein